MLKVPAQNQCCRVFPVQGLATKTAVSSSVRRPLTLVVKHGGSQLLRMLKVCHAVVTVLLQAHGKMVLCYFIARCSSMAGSSSDRPALKRARVSSDVSSFEDDEDVTQRPFYYDKPHGSATRNKDAHLPDGPQTFRETFLWSDFVVKSVNNMFERLNMPCATRDVNILFTSSYSGIGMAEIASIFVEQSMLRAGLQLNLSYHSQTEIDETCRQLSGARHVFKNLLERVDDELFVRLLRLQNKFAAQRDADNLARAKAAPCGKPHKKKLPDHGSLFLEAACTLLDANLDRFLLRAHCTECGEQCSWVPEPQEGAHWLECAGNTCTPWSMRGKRGGWLDGESLVCLIWVYSLKAANVRMILNECVVSFPATTLFERVFPGAVVQTVVFSPVDLGIPTHRPRRYTLVLLDRSFPLCGQISLDDDLLTSVAFRRLHLTGSVFLTAPKNLIHQCLRDLAAARQLPERENGKPYGWEAVMVPGDRLRMHQHREEVTKRGYADFDINVDVTHAPGYSSSMRIIPTLLRNSKIFNLAAGRYFLVLELMGAQGLPFFLPEEDEICQNMPYDYMVEVAQTEPKALKSMCGNAMHVAQVGSLLAIICMFATR